ncbi:BgTH12-03409 [Blumeria graminis f. sp. triticale]|uniref:BgTH12-03409 n=1 Tax=Blumeria graminis f. sp. triticale TaxID=1689686 RepID=A0A9W4DCF7_BLUGR|nr:BgTH12-03409 [Blumeria graminis f. sp. triticale]
MQLISLVGMLLAASSVTFASLQQKMHCVSPGSPNAPNFIPNDAATKQACNVYRQRTPDKQGNSACQDCEVIDENGTSICFSKSLKIDDDSFQNYCKVYGGSFSEPRPLEKSIWSKILSWFKWF